MTKGKFKGKPTGERTFSTPDEIAAGISSGRPRSFGKGDEKDVDRRGRIPEEEDESEDLARPKHKGIEGLIEIENPNLVKPKNIKAKDIDIDKTTEMSRREREELEKQKLAETKQASVLERLAKIRQERADAAKKREEEKAAKEEKKALLSKKENRVEARKRPAKV